METLYKCPWCGNIFESGKDLHLHAKKHYTKQAHKAANKLKSKEAVTFEAL